MKKILSIILAVVLACSMFGVTAFAETLQGDVNGDNKVSAMDARFILQVVAGLKTVEDSTIYDVDGNGKVTASDARIVLQIVAGLYNPDTIIGTKEEQLEYFVNSFNGVKENATSVTLVSTTTYKCQDVEINPLLSGVITKEDIESSLADSYGTQEVNETYTGEDIALAFPPTGTTCTLTMDDIESIKVTEEANYYSFVVVVKGETNPTRGKGVGAVATVATQEDLQAMIDENEDYKGVVTMDAIYGDVTVKANIDKETGKIVSYSADAPLSISTSMVVDEDNQEKVFLFSVGLGTVENWTIAY